MCNKCGVLPINNGKCGCPDGSSLISCTPKYATHQHRDKDVYLCKIKDADCLKKYGFFEGMSLNDAIYTLIKHIDGLNSRIESMVDAVNVTVSTGNGKMYYITTTEGLPTATKDQDGRSYIVGDMIVRNETGDSSGVTPLETYIYNGLKWVLVWK